MNQAASIVQRSHFRRRRRRLGYIVSIPLFSAIAVLSDAAAQHASFDASAPHEQPTDNSEIGASTPLFLTAEERAWIAAHPVVRLGVDPEFHPFEFIDKDGEYRGIAADYLEILGKRLGLRFEPVPGLSWDQAVEGVRKREVDLLPAVGITRDRKSYLLYSEPYVQFHRVVISRTELPFLTCLDDLASLRVAVQEASSHVGFLKENTDLTPLVYPTLEQTLLAVSHGEADAMIGNVASAAYAIRRINLTNLKVAAAAEKGPQGIHFAVRSDWPNLIAILQKGVDSMRPIDREAISKKWVVLKFDPEVRYGPLLLILLTAAIVVGCVLVWNRQRKRHRNQCQQAKEAADAAKQETERVNRELRDLSMKLEDEVELRTLELRQSQEQFYQAQKLEALGTLVGGIAHDFNNVLTGLLGAIELASDDVPEGEAADALTLARDYGFRGADLITQLLAFARQEQAGKAPLPISRLTKSLRTLAGPAVMKGTDFTLDAVDDSLRVYGNLALLQQALLNLLTNARDATAEIENPKISVHSYPLRPTEAMRTTHPELADRDYVAFEVRDNGKGISQGEMTRLFDPFFTTKAPGRGTGLGLPMVYGAVHDHRGAVWAESEPGKGSAFYLLLPLLVGDSEAEEAEADTVAPGAEETVLLVEDEATVRDLHRRHLIRIGYQVITACDGDEAMARFAENRSTIDILLLDVILPGKDGVFVAKEIRKTSPNIPVLFLTGYETGRALNWVDKNRRASLLKKPAAIALLSRSLRALLQ